MAAGLEDAARLPVTLHLVRKEHHTKLARHGVEDFRQEWKGQRIGLLPRYPAMTLLPCGTMIEHRLVEIGCDNTRLRGKPRCHCPGKGPGASGGFQYLLGCRFSQPDSEVVRISFEKERDNKPIVDLGAPR
jgi:hypothetical protein